MKKIHLVLLFLFTTAAFAADFPAKSTYKEIWWADGIEDFKQVKIKNACLPDLPAPDPVKAKEALEECRKNDKPSGSVYDEWAEALKEALAKCNAGQIPLNGKVPIPAITLPYAPFYCDCNSTAAFGQLMGFLYGYKVYSYTLNCSGGPGHSANLLVDPNVKCPEGQVGVRPYDTQFDGDAQLGEGVCVNADDANQMKAGIFTPELLKTIAKFYPGVFSSGCCVSNISKGGNTGGICSSKCPVCTTSGDIPAFLKNITGELRSCIHNLQDKKKPRECVEVMKNGDKFATPFYSEAGNACESRGMVLPTLDLMLKNPDTFRGNCIWMQKTDNGFWVYHPVKGVVSNARTRDRCVTYCVNPNCMNPPKPAEVKVEAPPAPAAPAPAPAAPAPAVGLVPATAVADPVTTVYSVSSGAPKPNVAKCTCNITCNGRYIWGWADRSLFFLEDSKLCNNEIKKPLVDQSCAADGETVKSYNCTFTP